MDTTHGWTTGDPSSIATWEHLPSGLRCHLVLQDTEGEEMTPTAWAPVEEFLTDDAGHAMAHLVVRAGEAQVEIECGGDGEVAACRILNIQGAHVKAHWEIEDLPDGWQIKKVERDVLLAPYGMTLPDDVPGFIAEQRDLLLHSTPRGQGELAAPLAAAEAIVAANTVRLPETDELITLSRHEMEENYFWTIRNWETFLTALGIVFLDPTLAVENCRTGLRHLIAGNYLATADSSAGLYADYSHPPVAAYAIWKIFQMTDAASLLEEAYPTLLHWHDWWRNFRDGNHNMLLNWATPAESGMPTHPLYAGTLIDTRAGEMMIDDVGLTSLWALDAFALMRMALQLNDLDQATRLETELNELTNWMNLALWEPSDGMYLSHDWAGHPLHMQSATYLLALAGGIPSKRRAERVVGAHLLMEFDTPFMVPTVGSDEDAYGQQQPWVGRVSPLLNYLICEGLRRYGEDGVAERIILSGLRLLGGSWQQHQGFASYNAISGHGDDIVQDPLSPYSALFGALGISMLIDVEPWGGLRLGNLHGVEMGVTGVPLLGHRYDVTSRPDGLFIACDGQPWLGSDQPVIIRNLMQTAGEISLQVKVAESGGDLRLRFAGFEQGQQVSVKVNGVAHPVIADGEGTLERVVHVPPAHGMGEAKRGV